MQLITWVWHSCELELDPEIKTDQEDYLKKYFSGKLWNFQATSTHAPIKIISGKRKIGGNYQKFNHYEGHTILWAKVGPRIQMMIDNILSIEYDSGLWLSMVLPKEELRDDFIKAYIARTIRTYMDKMLIESGFSFFHLWAIKMWENVVLISWNKWAGKTTTVITALENFWAQYISNDRVWWKCSQDGLHITEREGDTKIWEQTIQNSRILSQHNTEKDDKTGKFHYPQVYTLFWDGERQISWIAQHIFCPHVLDGSKAAVKKILNPDDVLFNSFEEIWLWFNQYRVLFGEITQLPIRPRYQVIKEWWESFGPEGIQDALKILSNSQ